MESERMELTTRRYNKQTYTFYLNKLTSGANFGQLYVTCETPPNDLGYPDVVLLASPSYDNNFTPRAYTLPNWILNKIEAILIKLAKEYTNEI